METIVGEHDSPRQRCEFYRRVCLLPAVFELRSGAITMNAGLVWAVVFDAALGSAVRDELRDRDVSGPIISHPDTSTWTLLTRSDIPVPLLVEIEQWDTRVRVLRGGSRPPPPSTRRRAAVREDLDDVVELAPVADVITLPSPTDQGHRLRQWIVEAHDDVRPSGVVVVDAVRAAIRRADTTAPRARAAAP